MKRLHDAGAVLVAKLSLGALALNDVWFGGQTMNPWLLEEGASGSSAGPGAATAAGWCILDRQRNRGLDREPLDALRRHRTPANLRPRSADRCHDAVLVARQTRPHDSLCRRRDAGAAGDFRARPRRCCRRAAALDFDPQAALRGLRVGYFPGWMDEAPNDVERDALERSGSWG